MIHCANSFDSRFYLMQSFRLSSMLRALALGSLIGANIVAQTPPAPQTPTQTPPSNPAQPDATRPPGTEQRQAVPSEARPTPQNPPGVTTQTPNNTGTRANGDAMATREPNLPAIQARPIPPLPSLSRLGVTQDNTLALTLNETIRRALENNNDIEVARNDVRFAESTLRALEGFYDPVFNLTPQYTNSITPTASRLGGGGSTGTLTQNTFSLNNSVIKPFSVGGGSYQLFFNNNRQTTSSTFSTLTPTYNTAFGIQFTQPLLRDRSIDNQRRQIRIQKKRVAQSDADFRRKTIEVIAQVQRAYWDLVFALRDQQNRISNVNLAREDFRRTEASIAAGASAPLQRAEIGTELATRETDLLTATQQVSIAENTLKQLMLRDPLAKEWSMALMPTDEPKFDDNPVNLTTLLEEGRTNRPELARQRLQQEINDVDVRFFKNQTRPRVDLTGTFSTNGLAGTDPSAGLNGTLTPLIVGDPTTNSSAFLLAQINQLRTAQGLPPVTTPLLTFNSGVPQNLVGGFGQSISNLANFNTRTITVGATIQIPLRNRTAQANLAGALVQRDQLAAQIRSQEQQVEIDVRNSAQSVETARQRIIYAREARQSAEQQLAGEQKLFAVGRSTTFLLFQRENSLVAARNQELRAETDYNKALADLQRATSTTLRANNVVVESLVAQ